MSTFRIHSSIILFTAISIFACQNSDLGSAEIDEEIYFNDVAEWKQNRVESLKSPTGWLRLAGMFILNEGENTIGGSSNADFQFPGKNLPDMLGTVTLTPDGRVTLQPAKGVEITHNGNPVHNFVLFDGENAPHVEYENLEWFIIIREELTAIRLYNKENQKADNFTGFPAYPVDPVWNRKAKFIPNPEGTTLTIANVLGQQTQVASPGTIEFTIDQKRYTLDALEADDQMFIIVGDQTNRSETYPAGRYIYINYPPEGSQFTTIDFNKIYNPPCAFNTFTTCQLPPPQNRLDVSITAGEKRPVEWQGLQ